MATIYKICDRDAWRRAEAAGVFRGNADDIRDGFIHLSAADQLAGTLERHFAGQDNLVFVAVDADRLGPALKWEPSRSGALFPHLYGVLPMSAVVSVEAVPGASMDEES